MKPEGIKVQVKKNEMTVEDALKVFCERGLQHTRTYRWLKKQQKSK